MKKDTRKKVIFWFWFVLIAPFAGLAIMLLCVGLFAKIPSFEELEHPNNKLATQLISCDGVVFNTYHVENRTYVPFREISPYAIQAAVATEDARFYRHCGVDWPSIGRVLVKTLIMRDSSQGGGSTITQQLAKTLYPRDDAAGRNPFVMVWTKFKEWITAYKLERDYTKDEIVAMYLNSVFFGSGAYGIKAASQTFFSKQPSALTIEEAATLVGMVNKPTRYNPYLNPDQSLKRRNFVLGRLCGQGFISEEQRDSLCALPITLFYHIQDHNAGLAPYFRDMLRREMNAQPPKRSQYRNKDEFVADTTRWNEDNLYGWLTKNPKPDGTKYNLDRDGLKIYCTIDSRMQKYAEEAVRVHLSKDLQLSFNKELKTRLNAPFLNDADPKTTELIMSQARRWSDRYLNLKAEGLSESEIAASFNRETKMRVFCWEEPGYKDTTMTPNDSIRYYKSILRASFVAIEPMTGNIKAYVGGPNYRNFKYDNVRQGKRQVGSTIKPFLYTLAMQEGMSPCTEVINMPQSFMVNGDTWTPRSTDKDEWIGRTVTLKWGLTNSSNNISAYLMKQFGPSAMAAMMHKMGVTTHLDEVYSLCVGPADLSLYEMVAAYNVFPSQGVYSTPLLVTRIEDHDGNLLADFVSRKKEAISDRTAYLMVNLMRGVIDSGTGRRLHWKYGLDGEISGKTGTTNDNSDGWFIGYTPKITAGVWVGAEDRTVHFESAQLGQGSNMALPVWGEFMKRVYADPTLGLSLQDRFPAPTGMTLDLSCTGSDTDSDLSESVREQSEEEDSFF